jgi:type I restriction enzyme S subunit
VSEFNDLIMNLCPDGVAHRPLGEVGTFTRGNGLQKKDLTDTGVGAIHYGQVFTHYGTAATETKSFVAPDKATKLRKAKQGDLVIATTSENDEDVCKAVAWMGPDDIAVSGDACIYSHSLDARFVAYLFQSAQFQAQKSQHVTGTKVRRVSGADLARIVVPVPPMEVQRAVVDIVVKMEELEGALKAELHAEMRARTRQYTHYRDFLVSGLTNGETQKQRFGDVATIVRGGSPRPIKAFLTDDVDGVNWIKIGDVPAAGKYVTRTAQRITPAGGLRSRRVEPGDFILSNSMSFGRPYIVQIEGFIHDGWLAIKEFDAHFDANFLYHLLRSTPVYADMANRAGSGTVKNLNADIVKSLKLPMPPMEEQRSIAQTLDTLDGLVNNLTAGLPAEIAARRKQFEYYRDLLLTFPEKKTA